MSTRIAVVGITGDPPTLGHVWLAQTADRTGRFDQVWLMPCGRHRYGKQTAPAKHRLAMTRLAADYAGGRVIASAYEMEHQDGTSLDGSCFVTTSMLREDRKSTRLNSSH